MGRPAPARRWVPPHLRPGDHHRPRRMPRIPQLDTIRGFGLVMVLVFHAAIHLKTRTPLAAGGYLGLDLFFVLSGFLITLLLLLEHERQGRIDYSEFTARRSARIIPALAAAAIGTAVLFVALFDPMEVRATIEGVASSLLNVTALTQAFDLSTGGWLGHTWSLTVEFAFYLLWPLVLMWALRRHPKRLRSIVVGALVLSVLWRYAWIAAGTPRHVLHVRPDLRFHQLLVGAVAAVYVLPHVGRRRQRSITADLLALASIGAIATMIAVSRFWWSSYRAGLDLVVAAAVAVLAVHVTLWPSRWPARLLNVKPLVWLGRRSYGAYLWHGPLYGIAVVSGAVGSWEITAAAIAGSIMMGAVSYHLVEQPARRLIRRTDPRRAVSTQPEADTAPVARRSDRTPPKPTTPPPAPQPAFAATPPPKPTTPPPVPQPAFAATPPKPTTPPPAPQPAFASTPPPKPTTPPPVPQPTIPAATSPRPVRRIRVRPKRGAAVRRPVPAMAVAAGGGSTSD